jgi:hypothetical protein
MSIQARHSRFTAARNIGRRFGVSIGTKIILPYFLLTLAVAGVGAFVVTNLVASSLEERIQNQLVDAGQIVSEGIVRHETQRLQTLRAVIGTEGIPAAVAAGDRSLLSALAPQIIINSNTDAVELLDMDGVGIYGWHRTQNESSLEGLEHPGGLDFSGYDAIQRVLRNETDVFGNKRILLHETADNLMIYTASPIFYNGEQVGAAMVGTYTRRMMLDLTLNAVARVT